MQIANPIYDVVFKYLMEDQEIAKLIISTIINEEIESLTFLPLESTLFLERQSLTVYRLDFSAKIKKADGSYKQVLIEIQKAKFATDIMRFRRYLGEQYQEKANSYLSTTEGKTTRKAMPIVSIYFLGYQLEQITAPVIKVARQYYDLTTGEEIQTREEFIESLTHDSYVIQIPYLQPNHQSEVEQLLAIFDQHRTSSNDHILTINEVNYPRKYRKVVRRLQRAIAQPKMRRTMDAEDDILEELEILEREIARKDQALVEKDKVLEEQLKMIKELQERLQSLDSKD